MSHFFFTYLKRKKLLIKKDKNASDTGQISLCIQFERFEPNLARNDQHDLISGQQRESPNGFVETRMHSGYCRQVFEIFYSF